MFNILIPQIEVNNVNPLAGSPNDINQLGDKGFPGFSGKPTVVHIIVTSPLECNDVTSEQLPELSHGNTRTYEPHNTDHL